MTPGHKHRTIKVRRNGLVHKVLTTPIVRTTNLPRVEASPYPYGVILHGEQIPDGSLPTPPNPEEIYYLSFLSVLHRWTGLCLQVPNGDSA